MKIGLILILASGHAARDVEMESDRARTDESIIGLISRRLVKEMDFWGAATAQWIRQCLPYAVLDLSPKHTDYALTIFIWIVSYGKDKSM